MHPREREDAAKKLVEETEIVNELMRRGFTGQEARIIIKEQQLFVSRVASECSREELNKIHLNVHRHILEQHLKTRDAWLHFIAAFVFAAALNQGWSLHSPIDDSPITITGRNGKSWSPKNYGGKYHGQTTLADALAHSLNCASVRIMQKTG